MNDVINMIYPDELDLFLCLGLEPIENHYDNIIKYVKEDHVNDLRIEITIDFKSKSLKTEICSNTNCVFKSYTETIHTIKIFDENNKKGLYVYVKSNNQPVQKFF